MALLVLVHTKRDATQTNFSLRIKTAVVCLARAHICLVLAVEWEIIRRLGIANFRFHDLRHTAASWLRMSGADIDTVVQLLGHKNLRMAARYQPTPTAKRLEGRGELCKGRDLIGHRHQHGALERLAAQLQIRARNNTAWQKKKGRWS